MRIILCLSCLIFALGAEELRINRGILPGGLIDDKKVLLFLLYVLFIISGSLNGKADSPV